MKDQPIRIWDVARDWLGGGLLGKQIREFKDDAQFKKAILETLKKDPADPKAYLLGILKNNGKEVPLWTLSNDTLFSLAADKEVKTYGKTRQQLIDAIQSLERALG